MACRTSGPRIWPLVGVNATTIFPAGSAESPRPKGLDQLKLMHEPVRLIEQRLALSGHAHATTVAIEQLQSELMLQARDATAQRRLCGPQGGRSLGKALVLGDLVESLEIFKFHCWADRRRYRLSANRLR